MPRVSMSYCPDSCILFRYDVDNNGTIDFDELRQVVTQDLKSEISDNDLQDLYDSLDQDGDGKVHRLLTMSPATQSAK